MIDLNVKEPDTRTCDNNFILHSKNNFSGTIRENPIAGLDSALLELSLRRSGGVKGCPMVKH